MIESNPLRHCVMLLRRGGRLVRRQCWLSLVFVIGVIASNVAVSADAVKLEGFWIQDVIVDHISETNIVYISGTGSEVSRDIQAVEGIYLSAYTELEQAEQALDEGDYTTAKGLLERVNNRASEQWIKQWVSYRLLKVYNEANEPLRLADTIVGLARGSAPRLYMVDLPVACFAHADEQVRSEAVRRLESATKLVRDKAIQEVLAGVTDSINSLEAGSAPVGSEENVNPSADSGGQGSSGSSAGSTGVSAASAQPDLSGDTRSGIVLPNAIDRNNQTIRLLLSGEASLAVRSANQELDKGQGQVAMYLYLRGMAHATVGDQSDDRDAYLDAGLSFMEVVVNYPTSIYAGPSLVELGYVHDKIGRADKARQLYATATETLDNEDEPRYVQRLSDLRQGVAQ